MTVAEAYARQIRATSGSSEGIPSVIAKRGNLDQAFHERLYQFLSPIIQANPDADWLTIGDSGGDAYWLRANGARGPILASSITKDQIAQLKADGHLETIEVAAVNAEAIDLPDASHDFVLCKEAFHHFPRPMVGFYEMMRVARTALVFAAEPCSADRPRLLDLIKTIIKTTLRRNTIYANPDFEQAGNYIYGLSLFEVFKALTALQLGPLYYQHRNAFWTLAVASRARDDRLAGLVMRGGVLVQDIACRLGLMNWGRINIIAFRQEPSPELARSLAKAGVRRIDIPVNPYS